MCYAGQRAIRFGGPAPPTEAASTSTPIARPCCHSRSSPNSLHPPCYLSSSGGLCHVCARNPIGDHDAKPVSGPLINRNFALLWSGQSISFIGDALLDFTFALWIAFDLGRGQSWAPLAVSGVLAASSVGTLVIGPISGVFVDRWDKRRTMLTVILLQAFLSATLLLFADLTPLPFFPGGHPSLEVKLVALYVVIFLVYGLAQFARAARTALIGDIVAEPDQPQASGLIETMSGLSFIIGFGVAPLLFVPFGIGIALLADALSFVSPSSRFWRSMRRHRPAV